MKYKTMPPLDLLQSLFCPDFEAGTLVLLKSRPGCKVGHIIKSGPKYRKGTQIAGKKYMLSRLLWYMHTGKDPGSLQIDHIDGDISNNAISNLRAVTQSQNNINRATWSKSGHKGIYARKRADGSFSYQVQLHRTTGRNEDGTYKRKTSSHGSFDTLEAAQKRYAAVMEEQHAEQVAYLRSSCADFELECGDL